MTQTGKREAVGLKFNEEPQEGLYMFILSIPGVVENAGKSPTELSYITYTAVYIILTIPGLFAFKGLGPDRTTG